jgi:hypothetical protein
MGLYPTHKILHTLEEQTQYPPSCSRGILMDMKCPLNTSGVFSKCLMSVWKYYVSSQKNPSKKRAHHIK